MMSPRLLGVSSGLAGFISYSQDPDPPPRHSLLDNLGSRGKRERSAPDSSWMTPSAGSELWTGCSKRRGHGRQPFWLSAAQARCRLIQGPVRLPETRQPCLAPYTSGGGRTGLSAANKVDGREGLDLSTAQQAYPWRDKLIHRPLTLSGARQAYLRQDNLVSGKTTLSASRTRLSAAG
jgi:hypothetical protein